MNKTISTNIQILIDTNIYLDFYRSNNDSIKILSEVAPHFDKIILTDQIILEFERNREIVIKDLKKKFESESKLDNISSAYLHNLPEFSELIEAQKSYQDKRQLVINAINEIFESPEKDPVYTFFYEMVDAFHSSGNILATTDEIIAKAQKRKLIGNPPTSSGYSVGDEINWEIILANVKENIILVGRDNTYTNNFSFLKKEFHLNTGKQINTLTDRLTQALKAVGATPTKESIEAEQKMLEELKKFNAFWAHNINKGSSDSISEVETLSP